MNGLKKIPRKPVMVCGYMPNFVKSIPKRISTQKTTQIKRTKKMGYSTTPLEN
jgi:hypothetical protein